MYSGLGKDEARFITEFVILENYPDATIIESRYDVGMEVNMDGKLVNTTSMVIKAMIPSTTESITIDLKIFNR